MYTIKNLAEKSLKKDLLEEFLNFANEQLEIDNSYSVYFVEDKDNVLMPWVKRNVQPLYKFCLRLCN